jgi:tRNA 2-thiouridine synthesizing protein A
MKKLTPVKINDHLFEIDLRGWICPLPKYVLGAILPKMETGMRVNLLVDCPGAITDIPKDAAEAGCGSEVIQIADGEWKIGVMK